MKLYVGNLSYNMTESDLKDLFSTYGSVVCVNIITDHYTRQSKCFGYVTMANQGESNKAIASLNGKKVNKRSLVVKQARPRGERFGHDW